ncbi:hypothetical protein WMF28_26440 [Sorangium sp. So ce590]|uniref:hypothetical protein n=1 Tax=Sorangium sp. So ce590 TaxID=3133317 RepID=UPI003F6396D5
MKSLSAVILALFSSLFGISCILDAEPTNAGDPTGEAQQQFPIVSFSRKDFPFGTIVKDDGKDEGGGWQEAKANLPFSKLHNLRPVRRWTCSFRVGMPLRTQRMGRIRPNRAAMLSIGIAEDVARRMNYNLPEGIFCSRFIDEMRATFKSKYPRLGATVMRP